MARNRAPVEENPNPSAVARAPQTSPVQPRDMSPRASARTWAPTPPVLVARTSETVRSATRTDLAHQSENLAITQHEDGRGHRDGHGGASEPAQRRRQYRGARQLAAQCPPG